MAYDFELPDGTIVTDVDDDVDPKVLLNKFVDDMHKTPDTPKAEIDMSKRSFMDNLRAGTGKGLVDVALNVSKFFTPDEFPTDRRDRQAPPPAEVPLEQLGISDQQMAEREERDRQLVETPGGMAGEIVGEVAATMFPGGAAIKGMQGASKLLNASSKLPRASKLAGRVVGSTPALLAAEGATVGALSGDDVIEGATTGAAIGGGLGVAGKVGKKLIDKLGTGFIKKSEAAAEVEALTGESLPVSMAAESEGTKQFFGELLTYFPGFNINKQVREAKEVIKGASTADAKVAVDEVLKGAKGEQRNIFQKLAAHSVLKSVTGSAIGTAVGGPGLALGVGALTVPMTSKSGQKILLGNTKLQKAVKTLIAKEAWQQGLVQGGRKAGTMATSVGATAETEDRYGSY